MGEEKEKGKLVIYLQYYEREINLSRIMQKAYQDSCARIVEPVTELRIYVKTEDGKAYYVANEKYQCYVNLWDSQQDFCDTAELKNMVGWKSDIKRNLIFEYRGKQCDCDQIVARAVEKYAQIYGKDKVQDVEIYFRQEEETAYFVINGGYTGSIPMYH